MHMNRFVYFGYLCGRYNLQNKLGFRVCRSYFYRQFVNSSPVNMAIRLFEGREHAQSYAQFRPTYPQELFKTIVNYYEDGKRERCNFELAVDVGCGNGQSSRPLCNYFRRVIGSDVSPEQISSAKQEVGLENLSFVVSQGEELGFLGNDTVDLLTISQALHWLDHDKFYREVTRVLTPGGVFAAFGYGLNKLKDQRGHEIMWQFYNDLLGSYWDEKRCHVDDHYSIYHLPFPGWRRIESPDLTIKRVMTINDYVGYLSTFSAWRKYDKENPSSGHLEKVRDSFREVYGDSGKPIIDVTWPIFLLIGRKPT